MLNELKEDLQRWVEAREALEPKHVRALTAPQAPVDAVVAAMTAWKNSADVGIDSRLAGDYRDFSRICLRFSRNHAPYPLGFACRKAEMKSARFEKLMRAEHGLRQSYTRRALALLSSRRYAFDLTQVGLLVFKLHPNVENAVRAQIARDFYAMEKESA